MYTPAEQKEIFERTKAYLAQQYSTSDVDEQLHEIRHLLSFHEHRYYVLNEPVISDTEYDELYKPQERLK